MHTATAPVFGVVLVPDRLEMAHAIAAGRAWQRLHLAATAQGLAAQPLNQPVQMVDRHQMLGRNDEFGPVLAQVPFSPDVLRKEVDRILEGAELHDRVNQLNRLVANRNGFERVISQSVGMRPVLDRAIAASRSDTPVLIVGETGTGKELIARAIHGASDRATRPLVPINCAALPHDLVESELFGHRRGAFSGALSNHSGLFVAAHGGTVFLDEIAELPMAAQAKLLRVLQDGEVRPVGALESRHVDVRIIAATNRSLQAMRNGLMRPDLFFRLSVLIIDIPPLRDRLKDLPLLIAYFLAEW